ncbi:hypothetical protein ACE1OE_18955 [Vibrio sp. E150_011]
MIELKYTEDESAHSWVFRNLLVSGMMDFSSVIGVNGYMHAFPSFTKDCNVQREKLNDVELLAFLRRSGLARKRAGLYDNPFDYLDSVNCFFDNSLISTSGKGSIPIRFCRSCIVESIGSQGYGYLKSEWLFESWCNRHQKTLIQLKAFSHKKAVNILSRALVGEAIPECDTDEYKQLPTRTNNEDETKVHIMPCLLDDFYRWASMWRDDDYLGRSFKDYYYADGRRKPISDRQLHSDFTNYGRELPKQFVEFFSRAEYKDYWFGLSQACSLKETLIKSKNHNCSKCTRWSVADFCPVKPIIKVRLEAHDFMVHTNPCDFFLKHEIHMHRYCL